MCFVPIFKKYSAICPFSVLHRCQCVYKHQACRKLALQQNWQIWRNSKNLKGKINFITTLYLLKTSWHDNLWNIFREQIRIPEKTCPTQKIGLCSKPSIVTVLLGSFFSLDLLQILEQPNTGSLQTNWQLLKTPDVTLTF